MLGEIFSALGGTVGKAFGGGILSTIGRFVGRTLGDYLEHLNHKPAKYHQFKNIKESFYANTAQYGAPIPLTFGTMRLSGQIIWATQIHEVQNSTTSKKYFPIFKQVKSVHTVTECEYYLSFAVSICEGEISEINRIWANDELLPFGKYNFRLYKGSESQLPDPLIEKLVGINKTPAFRGLCYIVFENLLLEDFNNSIPNFSFEVIRKANIPADFNNVENLVQAINMIPGSGEFVYDTIVQYKKTSTYYGGVIDNSAINSYNYQNIADSVYSLNQLQITCPNVKWVAPVVCWFADNLDIGICNIKPAIEFNDPYVKYSEEWQVGKFTRNNAKLISKDHNNNPNYGGSVNDASVIRYLQELKLRGLKIMFYPMFFLDLPGKPWRGHVTGSVESVTEFFNKASGYNNFILHYAKLIKGLADVFIIGSELIGLTSIKDSQNNFPAVHELTKLAKLVKEILGQQTLVTYAADWSEYHHTSGGWYNLDPLFASEYIDFIGIDAYFPITNTLNSQITSSEIINGLTSGEGYDYYLDWQGQQHPLSAPYAWKNIQYWWENYHYNPDGKTTNWQPKMKKIWFTEFGFPSIDKATNQPNVFFDPNCTDGGVPKYSSGTTDFSLQRTAIKAFIEYFAKTEYIEEMFLWTWDARPYPAWPHSTIWQDNYLWEKGHWVNGKFGVCGLAAIILELSYKCGIDLKKIDVSTLNDSVDGLILNKNLTSLDVINSLRIAYFFDILADAQEQIKFVKRGNNFAQILNSKILIKSQNNTYLEQEEITPDSILSKLSINFIDRHNNYQDQYYYVNNEKNTNMPIAEIRFPLILTDIMAETIGKLILKNANLESKIIKFTVPIHLIKYQASDFVILNYLNIQYQIRIIAIKFSRLTACIIGIVDEIDSYYMPSLNSVQQITHPLPAEVKCIILDLPFNLNEKNNDPYLAVYLQSAKPMPLYASVKDEGYTKISTLTQRTNIGTLVSFESAANIEADQIDTVSKLVVFCKNFENLLEEEWNLAICGEEIIKFKKWEKISSDTYQLTELMRGDFATIEYTNSHTSGENFILLKFNVNIIPVSEELVNKEILFKIDKLKPWKFKFHNKAKK